MSAKEEYRRLNESFSKVLVYHVGIDAGFFAEYTAMINAMLYCLENKLQFRLYSEDANFCFDRNWNDYFNSFCPEETDPIHRKNLHRVPSVMDIIGRAFRENRERLFPYLFTHLKWKLKRCFQDLIFKAALRKRYACKVYGNSDAGIVDIHKHFHYPELGIDGSYLDAFRKMVEISWDYNAEIAASVHEMAAQCSFPGPYIGTQIRGGDKITEVKLLDSEEYIGFFRLHKPEISNVFVLTDDYRIYRDLSERFPEYNFKTLCSPQEEGYVNSSFSSSKGLAKKEQMTRLLASMDILMKSDFFVGSITTGPSFFLLKCLYPDACPIDADIDIIPEIATLRIYKRGEISRKWRRDSTSRAH